MKAFIFGQYWKEEDRIHIEGLLQKLNSEAIEFAVYEDYARQLPIPTGQTISSHDELRSYMPDFIITLGGDGTILTAVTLIKDLGIPIVGINLGRLGFLASIEHSRISEAIDQIISGHYTISERTMLRLDTNPELFESNSFALNDFTILKRDNSAMVVVHAFVDDHFLNSYWADGLIVSTPTGSTGYSLSCGGPIIFPSSDNFILTPVAPHNLNVRPMVISGSNTIRLKIEGRAENYLCTLDSRSKLISSDFEIRLRKNDFKTRLINLKGDNFMKTIRNKLNWGQDKRNYAY